MFQSFKKLSWVLLLAFGQHSAWAFALGGPIGNTTDAWQVPTIGYGLGGDLVAPKNYSQGYRRNAQVYYYACDASFLNFFGTDGSTAIDQTFTILNNSLTNVDAYSSGLTEFPFDSQAINYSASALGLVDLKSEALGAMMEQLGLADPVRYAWTLHDRALIPNTTCPGGMVYTVVQRNFDITPSPSNLPQYSAYVNGTLWTYVIGEACTGPNPLALAEPVQVDLSADGVTAVAGNASGLTEGGYYISLTRDDMGGLRYLLGTNNLVYESPALGSVLSSSTVSGGTNYGPPFVLYTLDYGVFAAAALTNDPVTLSNLYPGLIITSSSNEFFVQTIPVVSSYYTNLTGAPIGSPPVLVVVTNNTYVIATNYINTYANVIVPPGSHTNQNTRITNVTVQVTQLIGAPVGSLKTNVTSKGFTLTNVPSGDFYILTNTCGPNLILSTLLTNVVITTNVIVSATNANGYYYSQSVVSRATNHVFVAQAIDCGIVATGGATNSAPGLYQGIGKIQFVKTSFDSLLGQLFQPITNTYSMELVSNSKLIHQTFQRVVTQPDFQFSSSDLAAGPAVYPPGVNIYARNVNFNQANIVSGEAGPGTIDTPSTITFNNSGSIYYNTSGGDELTELSLLTWGSFDGSTNDPVVYPNGTSIANLANQVLVQITPATLSDGTNGVAYPATTFVATGGAFTAPFIWSIGTGSGGLPAGLSLSTDGTISGTPTQSGTFDFALQMTDVNSRSVQWNYTITIE